MTDLKKWKGCGKNGCVSGWVPVVTKRAHRRFIGQWSSSEVGGDGRFSHPETGTLMKYHWPKGPDDPDFTTIETEDLEVAKCPCHPAHWSLSA